MALDSEGLRFLAQPPTSAVILSKFIALMSKVRGQGRVKLKTACQLTSQLQHFPAVCSERYC